MTKQFYFDRLEKGIKIIRTYDIMIHQQGNYKTSPHFMKVFGDFCVDYLKYKLIEVSPEVRTIEDVKELLQMCKDNKVDVVENMFEHVELIQQSKDACITDVAECLKVMPVTSGIIETVKEELGWS